MPLYGYVCAVILPTEGGSATVCGVVGRPVNVDFLHMGCVFYSYEGFMVIDLAPRWYWGIGS